MDCPLAYKKRKLKPLRLTDLKVHKQSHFGLNMNWVTKITGLSSGLLISVFCQISLTSSNGMADGLRSPILKPSGSLEAPLLSAGVGEAH